MPRSREDAQRFKNFSELSSEWYWEQNEHYRFKLLTVPGDTDLGIDPDDWLGQTRWDTGGVPLADGGSWRAHKALLDARRPFRDFIYKRSNANGQVRYLSTSGRPLFDAQGRFKGYCGIGRDVTARVRADLRAALKHGVTRILAESNSIGQAAPRLVRAICETLGWICGARWEANQDSTLLSCRETWGIDAPGVQEFLAATRQRAPITAGGSGLVRNAFAKGTPVWIDDVAKRANFRRKEYAARAGLHGAFAFPIKAGARIIGGMEFYGPEVQLPDMELLRGMTDIGSEIGQFCQRTQAEEARRASEEKYRTILESIEDAYYEVDLKGNFVFFNSALCRLLGYTESELLGMNNRRYQDPELAAKVYKAFNDVYRTGTPNLGYESEFERKDGSHVATEGSIHLMKDADGRAVGFRGILRDVTARRQMEQALRVSEERFRALTNLSSDWYWEQDAAFRFTRFDGRHAALRRAAFAGYLGKAPWETNLHMEADAWLRHRETLAAHRAFHDLVMWRTAADGKRRYISVSGEPIFDGDGRCLGYRGVGKDITERKQSEEELLRFRAAMDATPDMIYVTDRASMRFLWVNETGCRATGFSREELLCMGPADLLLVDRQELERTYDEVIAAGATGTVTEVGSLNKDGTRTVAEVRRRAVRLGGRWIIVTVSQDISARKRTEQAMRRISRMFAALGATNEAIMRAKSVAELYQRVCDAAVDGGKFLMTAILLPDAGRGSIDIAAVAGGVEQELRAAHISLNQTAAEGQGLVGTAFRTRASCVSNDFLDDARTRPWHPVARTVGVAAGAAVPLLKGAAAIGVLLLYSDEKHAFDHEIVKLLERLAENVVFALDNFEHEAVRKRAEERIQYLATHDGLTDLPNRVMFNQMLHLAIQSAQRYQRRFAVLFIDLDRFKVINDTLGHEAGDMLLQEMAARLKHCVRASDVVARLGGDEFVVLVQEVGEPHQVATVARKILSSAVKPALIRGQECRVTASIGIALYPIDADDEQSLMKSADMAMYLAKEEGKNNFQFYSKHIRARSLERMTLETHLRHALERDELSLHYQAKFDSQTGAIAGVEALLRWQSPALGAVSPAQFIPVAEETGLIAPIGRWALTRACEQNVAWQRQGLRPIGMAVNISARQFADEELLATIAAVLQQTGMAPELLELEITEGMVIHNPARAVELLGAIKRMGVRLAIDDFGTGYSSLGQLKHFPIDTLKVDRSFIREIPRNAEDKAITEAIIAMGKTLSLTVVAEGVETEEQARFLRARGCDQMQGYYFSRPLAPDRFAELLRTHPAA